MKKIRLPGMGIYFIVLVLLSCSSTKGQHLAEAVELNLKDFGALPDDSLDDSEAFKSFFSRIEKNPGNYVLSIPNGTFNIRKRIEATNLTGKIAIRGEKGTRLLFEEWGLLHLQAKNSEIQLLTPIQRNDSTLKVINFKNGKIEPGDLVHIQSTSPFETGWQYKENDIHRIRTQKKNELLLNSACLFNYDSKKEKVQAKIYKHCSVSLDNITMILGAEKDRTARPRRRTMAEMVGISLHMQNVELRYDGHERYFHIGLSILASENVHFNNIRLSNFMYAILLNYCRNVKGFNTAANYCRHAYTPTQASYDVYIENLRGYNCHSVMDAHVSFLVHYKNVTDTLATQFPNCRSLGTFIENVKVYVQPDAYQDYAYWSVQTLTKEYEPMYAEYDTRFSNVYWVPQKKSSFNGLTSFSCRRLIVEHCTTSAVAFYGNQQSLQQVLVSDSRLGVLRIDAYKTLVENTIFDGDLFKDAAYVWRFTGGGKSVFNNIAIKNYNADKTYLFDHYYNQPSVNSLIISNSDVGPLKGLTNTMIFKKLKYDKIKLNSVNIAPFKEEIQPEFSSLTDEMKKARKERLKKNN